MSKLVVRFALRVRLDCARDVPVNDGVAVAVEWKRGKHHGVAGSVVTHGGRASWETVAASSSEFTLPCTLYLLTKKQAFEDKELELTLCRLPGMRKLGVVRLPLHTLATAMGDALETTTKRADALDGRAGVLEYTVSLKRLVDPRDTSRAAVASPAPAPSPRVGTALAPQPLSPTSASGVSPVSPSTVAFELTMSADNADEYAAFQLQQQQQQQHQQVQQPPAVSLVPPVPIAPVPTTQRRSPRSGTAGGTSMDELPSAKSPRQQRATPPDDALATRESYASAGGMPSAQQVRGHQRRPSNSRAPNLDDLGKSDSGALTNASPGRPKKGILGGAGHRRGKSHAVTPEELKGLQVPTDLHPMQNTSSSNLASAAAAAARKSAAHGVKLFSKRDGKRSSQGAALAALLPQASGASSTSASPATPHSNPGAAASALSYLITGDSDDDDSNDDSHALRGSQRGVDAWLSSEHAGVLASPRRVASRNSLRSSDVGDGSESGTSLFASSTPSMGHPMSDGDTDDVALQERIARRTRDETFVFSNFVAFCEPVYSAELSVSAYVLFRCLVEWDSFSVDEGRRFREQLLEGFEKLSKSVNDQPRAMYWLSTAVSLLYLLRTQHKPIPRSEVAKSNAMVVFQERVRGLASVFFARVAALALGELRPLLAPVLLEQNSLEHLSAPGPSSPPHAPAHRAGRGPPRPTVAQVLTQLEDLRKALASARVVTSVVSQLFARLAHGIAAATLNALLGGDPRLCTFSNGLQMKKPVSELRGWFQRYQFEAAAKNLAPLDEIVNVLCMNKSVLAEADVRAEVCPSLSAAQLSQLLVQYTPDDFDSEPVPPAILRAVSGDLRQPFAYRAAEEPVGVLSLDLTEASYTLANIVLPEAVTEQPGLAFLATPSSRSLEETW